MGSFIGSLVVAMMLVSPIIVRWIFEWQWSRQREIKKRREKRWRDFKAGR